MRWVERFDDWLYRVEQVVVATMLAIMGVVVFLDVAQRVSTRAGSWLANPALVGLVAALVSVLAFRTRHEPWPRAVPKGTGLGIVLGLLQVAFVRLVPNGLVWSQTLALGFTLWLGTIGATLAAHDRKHLALDVGSKLWPDSMLPAATAVGHLVTAAFCLGIGYLGARSCVEHYELWRATEGAAGTLTALPIPKWLVFSSIPYGMGSLAFRFVLEAWRTWTGQIRAGDDDTLAQLGIQREPAE
ncbi:MAG: TRAP transporter small permease [bacterium]